MNEEVPENVARFVAGHLSSLLDIRHRMDSVNALDRSLSAGGRYLWEAWTQRNIQSEVREAEDGLKTFRELAPSNGVDPEEFINSLGGAPSFDDCREASERFNR